MYFSLYVERKVPKELRSREKPTVFPLRNPFPLGALNFAIGKIATRCQVGSLPESRNRGGAPRSRAIAYICLP